MIKQPDQNVGGKSGQEKGTRRLLQVFNRLKGEVKGLTLIEVKQKILDLESDEVIKARKKEILDLVFSQENILNWEVKKRQKRFESLRGYVFEMLISYELNDTEENHLIANFILECLRKPTILGIKEGSFRNPDHLGVVIDVEKKVAYVTGMYEVKTSRFNRKLKKQIPSFYEKLEIIIKVLNEKLQSLRVKYDLTIIPEGGVSLLPYNDLQKWVVLPRIDDDRKRQRLENILKENSWTLRKSVFTKQDINLLTAFILNDR